jgi:hypothetical protein
MDDSENQAQIVIFEHLCSPAKIDIDSRYLIQAFYKANIVEKAALPKFIELINTIKGGPPKGSNPD